MKKQTSADEHYPVYCISDPDPRNNWDAYVEITQDEWDRYQFAQREYIELQNWLKNLPTTRDNP